MPQTLNEVITQLRQCLVASKNRRDLGYTDPNFPDTDRYTIEHQHLEALENYFYRLQVWDGEFSTLYPGGGYRFEVATSGSSGPNVRDFKISPLRNNGNTGSAIFNYHIGVVGGVN